MTKTELNVNDIEGDQVPLLEEEVLRDRDRVANRQEASSTRAAVLIGAAGVLGGTELVTASGSPAFAAISLALYLVAAILGLIALRPKNVSEVDPRSLVNSSTERSKLGIQRSILASNILAFEAEVGSLKNRAKFLTWGFIFLAAAWAISGVGVVASMLGDDGAASTVIEIEGDVDVTVEPR